MPETVISAQNLDLTFETNDGPVHALKDITLDIAEGEFVSLIGPSGCGKTTLLRVIADLEKPTGGTMTVNGMTPEGRRGWRGPMAMCSSRQHSCPGAPSRRMSACRSR